MSDERPVPVDIADCPECGAELVVRVMSWDETGKPEDIDVDCIGDPECKHRYWQSDWQPVIDSVRRWIERNHPTGNTDRDVFLAALAKNEDDITTRMIFADWLDEHDEPEEAERVRAFPAAKKWLEEFSIGDQDWRDTLALIESDDYVVEYDSESWRDEFYDVRDEFYRNVEIVTGKKFSEDDRSNPFSCSC